MKLYRTPDGFIVHHGDALRRFRQVAWEVLLNSDSPGQWIASRLDAAEPIDPATWPPPSLLPPVVGDEVWAAGVTYLRSRQARMEEAKTAGGGDFYDRVYNAPRPELFFKATASRVVGHGDAVRIRRDSRWNVPEPELALAINAAGRIIGYTVGNDMSSRDIEGENPLYLPQAKVYDGSCALGPCLLLGDPLPPHTPISISIHRGGTAAFTGAATLAQMKRQHTELVEYLYRHNSFPTGCTLLTGTGTVPPDDFTLHAGDIIRITIDPIGTLENTVA